MSDSTVSTRSTARASSITQTIGNIDSDLQSVSGYVNNVQQATLQPQINYYSQYLSFYYN